MPREVIIECDRCGKKLNRKTDPYSHIICTNRVLNTVTNLNLCQPCYDGVLNYLENFMTEDNDEEN